MCKELKERKTKQNIVLNFRNFCQEEKKRNFEKFIEKKFFMLQQNIIELTGCALDKKNCIDILFDLYWQYKASGLLDILDREDEFCFK